MKLLTEYAKLADGQIKKILKERSDPKSLYEPIEYHLLGGGKRVRPFLCMVSCEAVGGKKEIALPAAVALELVHAFTLVHDDVMDKDEMRRGKPTIYKKWGEATAINVGDAIHTLCYKSIVNSKAEPDVVIKASGALIDSVLTVCEGQVLDIEFEGREITIKQYEDMARRKTGSLISGSCKVGAIIGSGSEKEIDALTRYGKNIGLAFQIWDDYIDFASKDTGKTHGSDIKRGKRTSIVCHALENSSGKDKERLIEILDSNETSDKEVAEAVAILEKTGSIEYGKKRAMELVENAKKSLGVLKDSAAKKSLLEFADFVINRDK
ncbi:MAG: polyprenyl synthetase family protein [archaeon]